jgi:hypothetical protein
MRSIMAAEAALRLAASIAESVESEDDERPEE